DLATDWVVDSGPADAWQIVDGAIVGKGAGSANRGWLLTTQTYTNFHFKCQFRRAADADGGIGFRAEKGDKFGNLPMHLAVKLRDHPAGNGDIQVGSIYYWLNTGERPARSAEMKPNGSWNDLEIEVRGQRIRIVVNGQEIQDFDLDQLARRDKFLPGV